MKRIIRRQKASIQTSPMEHILETSDDCQSDVNTSDVDTNAANQAMSHLFQILANPPIFEGLFECPLGGAAAPSIDSQIHRQSLIR
jgi:hypothetical protein